MGSKNESISIILYDMQFLSLYVDWSHDLTFSEVWHLKLWLNASLLYGDISIVNNIVEKEKMYEFLIKNWDQFKKKSNLRVSVCTDECFDVVWEWIKICLSQKVIWLVHAKHFEAAQSYGFILCYLYVLFGSSKFWTSVTFYEKTKKTAE